MSNNDQEALPQGIQLMPLDERFRENPYPILRDLRERAPVLEDEELKRFINTRHDDVKNILRDKDFWTDPVKANPGTFIREFLYKEGEDPSMLMMDEPDHRRLRMLVSKPFTPTAVEKWRPRTKEVIERVLNAIPGDEFDLIEYFAGPIPTIVIAEVLGLDPSKHDDFKTWSDISVKTSFNPFPTEEETAASEIAGECLKDFFRSEIKKRRTNLGEDLLSDMIRAEEEGEKLNEDEIISQCGLLLVAGNVTTTDLIGNGVKALIDNPEQLQKLRNKPELIKQAIEEMLRFDSPITNSGRIANRLVDIGACPAHKGETLMVSLAAANHDPEIYKDPEVFNIEREDTHHQAFGGGRHLCLGAHLARLEAQEAILALLERYPTLSHSQKGFEYSAVPSFRGMNNFWVDTK